MTSTPPTQETRDGGNADSDFTSTYTRARVLLIHRQFKGFAERFNYPLALVGKLPDAVYNRSLKGLSVYAKDSDGEAVGSPRIHQTHLTG